jgi:hypothetical protein
MHIRAISPSVARRSRDASGFGRRTSVVGEAAIHFHSLTAVENTCDRRLNSRLTVDPFTWSTFRR